MRVLFSSVPLHGHVYPLLPLAIAAAGQGHDVCYAVSGSLHRPLRDLGFATKSAGIEFAAALDQAARVASGDNGAEPPFRPDDARPRGPHPVGRLAPIVFGVVLPRAYLSDLGAILADTRPDLVVYDMANLGAGLAAHLAGVPAVAHGVGLFARRFRRTVVSCFAPVAAELDSGVDVSALFGPAETYLDICPPSLRDEDVAAASVRRFPMRPVAFAEPATLPAVVTRGDRPLVYLTLGTVFGDVDVLRAAIDGLAALDVQVVVAAGPTVAIERLGRLPGNVVVEPWVPQADLIPYTSLVVHHGGAGTTLAALAAGVPQLFLPQGADQPINAAAVVAAGAGDQLLRGEITAPVVTARATTLMSDVDIELRCHALATEIASMPSPAEVAGRFEEFSGVSM
jgi:UDP:flavonoid glycosyltransferase YjiC (YdhE family)